MGHVVVGVDGSEGSEVALRWAVGTAERQGLEVRVAHVYDTASLALSEVAGYAGEDVVDQLRDRAQELVDGMVDAVSGASVPVVPVLIDSASPARTLRHEARDADMLVVGTRGLGGFAGLVLGSVSHQVVVHPPCPVVVVPGEG